MDWLFLLLGLATLLIGGEALVKGSVAAATRLGVSPLIIGLTLVGFGTSMPELVASINAALKGAPGLALGNVVGSNIANILLIIGVSAVILPLSTTRAAFQRDGLVLTGSCGLLIGAMLMGTIGFVTGILFTVLIITYTSYTYLTERRTESAVEVRLAGDAEAVAPEDLSLPIALAVTAAGIAGVVIGAGWLVSSAVTIARTMGISETVIGLTLVSVGTSLPELATSLMAAMRRQTDLAFGNIVGSNIFNSLGITGITALVTPIAVPESLVRFDIWVMLAASLVFVAFALTDWRISRREGALFLAAYATYLWVTF